MKKALNIIKTLFFILTGLIVGCYVGKYANLRYENELMTNWLLKHEIKDYTLNKMEQNLK